MDGEKNCRNLISSHCRPGTILCRTFLASSSMVFWEHLDLGNFDDDKRNWRVDFRADTLDRRCMGCV